MGQSLVRLVLEMAVGDCLNGFEFHTLLSFWGHGESALLNRFSGDFAHVLLW